MTDSTCSSTPRNRSDYHHRTLSTTSRPSVEEESAPLTEKEEGNRRSSYESDDTFSLWSDTGDIAEQLADEEDPLRIQLQPLSSEGAALNGSTREKKKKKKEVHYSDQDHLERKITSSGVDKEAIVIPEPAPREVSRAEKILGLIMAPGSETARKRGLVGKPLLYDIE
ncbi:MAG: hypothetical protein Q9160_008703 [Pyrenula sp. 1 TL-2023]